jgi:hypothetical protein
MLIEVQRGVVDTNQMITVGPVILQDDGKRKDGTIDMDLRRYIFQVTLTHAAQVSFFYRTEEDANKEREFVLHHWKNSMAQKYIPKATPEGEIDE